MTVIIKHGLELLDDSSLNKATAFIVWVFGLSNGCAGARPRGAPVAV
jgi:hypothetical protein